MPEYWDIYDKDRRKTGRFQERGKPPASPEDYHLVVEIWLRNSKGEVLLTKRHPEKHYGGLWECTGGSVLAGEESLAAAMREVKEEIGVDLTHGNPGVLLASLSIRRACIQEILSTSSSAILSFRAASRFRTSFSPSVASAWPEASSCPIRFSLS